MPKLSRRSLGPESEKELIGELWQAVRDLDDRERVYLLDNLFTSAEKLMLAKRLVILKELGKGSDYITIKEKFKVISNTVSRVSNILRRAPQLLPILSKLDQPKKGISKNPPAAKKKNTPRRVMGSRTLAGSKRLMGWYS